MPISFRAGTPAVQVVRNLIVVAASKASFEGGVPGHVAPLLGPGGASVLSHLVASAAPSRDSGSGSESLVKLADGSWQRIAVCMLPKGKPSRHAARGHPHAITSLVRSHKGEVKKGEDLHIALVLENPEEEMLAACGAIPRAFPVFSMKSKESEEPEIVVHTGAESADAVCKASGFDDSSLSTADLQVLSDYIRECAALVDMPTNVLQVTSYIERINELIKDVDGVEMKIIRGEDLREQGFGGIYGVGKAAENPPALVILSHKSAAVSEDKSVCLIGKGIVYDTGGLSIKTKTGMPGMKRDMGGSAGMLGAFLSLVRSKKDMKRPFYCLLALAENSVGSNATRPDDVHHMYSGKTVEINNTDAEGRLVMADALAYACKHLNPDFICNMATLTGAQSSATGLKHGAIFTNLEEVEKLAVLAGQLSGDLVHPLPFTPEFFRSEFKSSVADMKNSQANRSNCGSAAPATFLSNHIEEYLENEGNAWLHIDMAAPAYRGERATGYGVALLFLALRSRF